MKNSNKKMAASDSLSGSGLSHHHITHHHHHIRRHRVPSGGEEMEDEELDPRIQVELEKLNRSSEEINRLELELDDARAAFRQVLSDSTQRLNGLAKKLGACVDKARPYYDARMRLKEAHLESQKAALRFERACSMHEAAKEMVQLAEEGYKRREHDLDPTWQEMLNHATMKVNDAERERIESEDFHQKTTLNFKRREEEVQKLQKDLKRTITKSKPYFEMKAKFNQVMEDHKRSVSRLEEDVASSKALYSQALRNLEAISDDIHRQRLERRQKLQLGVRGSGVGAEAPSPPPSWEKGVNIEGSASCNVFDSDGDEESGKDNRVLSNSSETVLDASQLKQNRAKGIVCCEPAFRKRASLTESLIKDGNLKSDPLDVVVFKTSSSDIHSTSKYSLDFNPSSVSVSHFETDRSCSHRKTRESSHEQDIQGWPRQIICEGPTEEHEENVVTPTPDNMLELSSKSMTNPDVEMAHREHDFVLSRSSRTDALQSDSSRKRDIELSQSSLSRAQEWVNKSPIPQQRRFVKSKSLIDASSSSLSVSSPSESELSSSLTTDLMKGVVVRDSSDKWPYLGSIPSASSNYYQVNMPLNDDVNEVSMKKLYDGAVNIDMERSRLNSSIPHFSSLPHNIRSLEREIMPEQHPPSSGSPSSIRKSKLQGLILRVDAAGISSSAQPSVQQSDSVHNLANHHIGKTPKVLISTQHPKVGVFNEKPFQPQSPVSAAHSLVQLSSSSLSPTSASLTAKPPTSLISQHLSKMMNVTKISQYNSKMAPSTLSTSYHLPTSTLKSPHNYPPSSPTRMPLSPFPASTTATLRHQVSSPTPSSPSADRYSLSGRSDSVTSGSHKSAFLKPPSDSSDTESIASTGPMLDDDQVELINMDFTEQSIAAECQEDGDYSVVNSDLGPLNRGHWSRMSLPPRLSYLEGFLERARLYSGSCKTDALDDFDDKLSNENIGNKHGNDSGSSSLAASGDLEDNIDDFKDGYCDSDVNHINDNNMTCVCSTPGNNMPQQPLEDVSQSVTSDTAVSIEIHLEDVDNAGQEDTFAGFEIVDGPIDELEGCIITDTADISMSDLEHLQDESADEIHTEVTVILPDNV